MSWLPKARDAICQIYGGFWSSNYPLPAIRDNVGGGGGIRREVERARGMIRSEFCMRAGKKKSRKYKDGFVTRTAVSAG